MSRAPFVTIVLVAALSTGGCIYTRSNLARDKHGYTDYPTSIEAEHARRKQRRRRALIAAPIEIVAGLAIAALAIYVPSEPSDAESVTGALGDAGKELLGRMLVATAGGAIALSGVGDGILGLIDPAFSSPLVRGGRLVPAAEIDTIAPAPGVRPSIHMSSMIGSRGVGPELGGGLAHWLSSTVRLRHAITSQLVLPFGSLDRSLVVAGEVTLQRAFGRVGAGLHPRHSIGIYGLGGYLAAEDRDDGALVGGGVELGLPRGTFRLGTSFVPGVDRRPTIELGVRTEIRVD